MKTPAKSWALLVTLLWGVETSAWASAGQVKQPSQKGNKPKAAQARQAGPPSQPRQTAASSEVLPQANPRVLQSGENTGTARAPNQGNAAEPPAQTLSMGEYHFLVNLGKNIPNKSATRKIYSIIESLKRSPFLTVEEYEFILNLAGQINNPKISDNLLVIAGAHRP